MLALIIVGAVIGVVIVLAIIEAGLQVEFMSEDPEHKPYVGGDDH